MRILKTWLKNIFKKEQIIPCIIGVYIGAVIWITLLCRDFAYTHHFIVPFWSYRKVIMGDFSVVVENIENILMFVPMGYLLQVFSKKDWKKVAVVAFSISLSIEITQYITTVGYFEFDDLLHNVLGALIGYCLYEFFPISIKMEPKRTGGTIFFSAVIMIILLLGTGKYK